MPTRVLLLQEQGFMAAGLKTLLEQNGTYSVVGSAASQEEALQICRTDAPELALIDFSVPQLNGVATILRIRREHPKVRVIILSSVDREDLVISALRSGASAFVLKQVSGSDLLEIVDLVSKGGSYLSLDLWQQLLQREESHKTALDERTPGLGKLTQRELEVLQLVATGQCSKDVATTLGLTIQTARSYRKTMMNKLGINNVAVLTAFAIANGVVSTDRPHLGAKPAA